jgi:hypothetical protein
VAVKYKKSVVTRTITYILRRHYYKVLLECASQLQLTEYFHCKINLYTYKCNIHLFIIIFYNWKERILQFGSAYQFRFFGVYTNMTRKVQSSGIQSSIHLRASPCM